MSHPELPEVTEYHKFVGLFVTEYAQLEHIIRTVIRVMSGLNEKKHEAIIGFPRSGEARALAKKLADLQDLPSGARTSINGAFDHLSTITLLRDRVVHFGGYETDLGILLANKDGSFSREHDITEQKNLWNAAVDLRRIKMILLHHLLVSMPTGEIREVALQQGPWRYIPPPQRNTHRPRGARVDQSPQPSS
jgi:hypothetical protein